MDVVVVSHTHWDREWYQPAPRFRQRLVALVDELLDAPGDAPFLLDGQGIVLDDYLALRPERRAALADALRQGRLEAGPWYVLADELIPGAEALVRNLRHGRAALRRLGAEPPPVLYCPDAFGHPAILPTLAAGFGYPLVIAWRGYGGARWPAGDTVRWRAPDGSSAVLYHLPPDGYETGSSLPPDDAGARERWARLAVVLAPRAAVDVVLLPNGADHHARQRALPAAVAALAAAAAPDRVRQDGLTGFARRLVARAADASLPTVEGELRDSYGYTWTLQGTFATRAAQKRRNARAERALLHDAEPWAALALVRDRAAAAPLLPALDGAWRTLLACHPHDTLCGCSTDAVAQAMDARLASALQQAAGVRADAMALLLDADPDSARGRREAWRPTLVVRNPVPRRRGGVVECELLVTIADEPVGPGSGAGAREARAAARAVAAAGPPPLPAIAGARAVQPLGWRLRRDRLEPRRHYPDNDVVVAWRVAAWFDDLAPFGVRAVPLGGPVPDDEAGVRVRAEEHGDGWRLHGGAGTLTVDREGGVRLATPDGAELHDLLGVEWQRDGGDLYTPEPVGPVRARWRLRGVRVRDAGPLRAELELRYTLLVPHARRNARRVRLPLRVRLRMDAGDPLLHVTVRGVNRARDHRLRLVLRTGIAQARTLADAAFGPVWRDPVDVPAEDRRLEVPPATAPLHRHVTLVGAARAGTLVSDGLGEYETRADGSVRVTLVRAVGTLSRGTLRNRAGHAGWPVPAPGAQCPGPFVAHLALAMHPPGLPPDEVRIRAARAAEDALVPPVGETWRWLLDAPPATRGPELAGDGLVYSACAPAEDGRSVVLRCVNVTERAVRGEWRWPGLARATLARLDETPLQPLDVRDGTAAFDAPPRGVVTVLVERAEERPGGA